jgi:Fic family protein
MPRTTGTYAVSRYDTEEVRAFVPLPLPPRDPPLTLDAETGRLLVEAQSALGQLNVASNMVAAPSWFIYAFVRKEAVVSSQIEGTQATLMDVLAYEATQQADAIDDVAEICNYLDALTFARQQLRDPAGLPLSLRLIREMHGRLMRGVRGANKLPGEFRQSQNWIGGTRPGNARFVPPPPTHLAECLDALERYLHQDCELPALVRAGLVHVQFETIHPFLDGNGRVGRLLVTLLLEHWGLLSSPLLYLSLYLKRHRDEYYARLGAVRSEGDWEGWTRFFLEGVLTIAREATESATALFGRITEDRRRLLATSGASLSAMQLFERLPEHPLLTVAQAVKLLDTTKPTAAKAIAALEAAGILTERTGQRRDRVFSYSGYLDLLCRETEPLRAA